MKPTHIFTQWKAIFMTGTGVSSWIAAVCALGFGVALAMEGVVGWIEVALFAGTVGAWALSQGRQRWASAKVEHKCDLALLALNQLDPREEEELNRLLDERALENFNKTYDADFLLNPPCRQGVIKQKRTKKSPPKKSTKKPIKKRV